MTDRTAYLAEYATDAPRVPTGSIVDYHGSISHLNGDMFEVIDPPSEYHAATPGSYVLRPVGPNADDLGPGGILYNVRPRSFTVLTDDDIVARWRETRPADHPRWPRDSYDDDADVALARAWLRPA